MKPSVKAFIWAAAIVLVLAGSFLAYRALGGKFNASSASSETLTPAADFTFYDAEGSGITFASKFGKPIVLNFWATWCGPCQEELPAFNKAYSQFGEKVEFIMINLDDPGTESEVQTFLSEQGYDFPVFYDTDYSGTRAYKVQGIPVSYFITSDGKIAAEHIGSVSETALWDYIDRISE